MTPKLERVWEESNAMEGNASPGMCATESLNGASSSSRMVGNNALKTSLSDKKLSPKSSLSPTSQRAFFFPGFKQKEADRSCIIFDARQAALEAANLASRGIILAEHTTVKKSNEQLYSKKKTGSTTVESHPSPSVVSSSSTSVTASHTTSGKTLITSTTLESGQIDVDGSVVFSQPKSATLHVDEKADKEGKKGKALRSKKSSKKFSDHADNLKPTVFKTGSAHATIVTPKTARKATQGLWICNLCGMAFTSLQGAQDHENMCVRMACAYSKFFDPTAVPTATLSSSLAEADTTKSSGATPTEGVVFLNQNVRKMMVMTDQSIIKVVAATKPYLFASAEIDSERELRLLARDFVYYSHIERRAELRREASGR